MENKRIVLDNRLNALAEVLGRCPVYADIGCDHGRLGASLIQRGWVQKAYLTDISADSLMKARKLIRLLGYEDRIEFMVCDGLPDCGAEAFVIAGMGGALISDILEKGRARLNGARLILQANVAMRQLRETLTRIGYRISKEVLIKDGRRFYVIMEAVPGNAEYSEEALTVGPELLRERPELLKEYAAFRARVAEKALAGAEKGSDTENIETQKRELEIWKRMM